ncbi:MAG TPA: family 43 glycosylhydrolase [Streptosporangiaceae bacterium]|nr:family 43 glycosylhydrolase [Streptosporangiaceae bacterium]
MLVASAPAGEGASGGEVADPATVAATAAATARAGLSVALASQPRPTSTPDAPGIDIAESPVYDIPDPFLLLAAGRYYLYFSSAFGDSTNSNVPVIVGSPGHWSAISDAMPNVPSWAWPSSDGATTWDPYVVSLEGHYVMYAAPSIRGDGLPTPMHCISVSVSVGPAGPFVPVGKAPLVCQPSLGGDIDAQLFYDPHGPRGSSHPYYLIWKSDNNNLPSHPLTAIWAAPMSNDGLSLAGKPVVIFRPTTAWEKPVLEAPQMVLGPGDAAWLFFSSGDGYYTPDYSIGVASCDGPVGGCHTSTSGPLITSNAQGVGPGEETVFVAADHSLWLLYNPWHSRIPYEPLRPAEAVRIGWGSRGPYVAQAGTFPAP